MRETARVNVRPLMPPNKTGMEGRNGTGVALAEADDEIEIEPEEERDTLGGSGEFEGEYVDGLDGVPDVLPLTEGVDAGDLV